MRPYTTSWIAQQRASSTHTKEFLGLYEVAEQVARTRGDRCRSGSVSVLGAPVTPATTPAAVLGACAIGLALGAGVGLLMYAGLARIPAGRVFGITNVLIALLAGSIASQLAKALAQAGLVERWSAPLWDSSAALAPDSALGTFLHALVGYDARPSGAQLAAYAAVLALIFFGSRLLGRPRAA